LWGAFTAVGPTRARAEDGECRETCASRVFARKYGTTGMAELPSPLRDSGAAGAVGPAAMATGPGACAQSRCEPELCRGLPAALVAVAALAAAMSGTPACSPQPQRVLSSLSRACVRARGLAGGWGSALRWERAVPSRPSVPRAVAGLPGGVTTPAALRRRRETSGRAGCRSGASAQHPGELPARAAACPRRARGAPWGWVPVESRVGGRGPVDLLCQRAEGTRPLAAGWQGCPGSEIPGCRGDARVQAAGPEGAFPCWQLRHCSGPGFAWAGGIAPAAGVPGLAVLRAMGKTVSQRLHLLPSPSLQAPSEYETSPEQLFYRIAHLNRGQQYLLWVAAVTSAGRGNISEKVTIEPAGKGTEELPVRGDAHAGTAVPCPGSACSGGSWLGQHRGSRLSLRAGGSAQGTCRPG